MRKTGPDRERVREAIGTDEERDLIYDAAEAWLAMRPATEEWIEEWAGADPSSETWTEQHAYDAGFRHGVRQAEVYHGILSAGDPLVLDNPATPDAPKGGE